MFYFCVMGLYFIQSEQKKIPVIFETLLVIQCIKCFGNSCNFETFSNSSFWSSYIGGIFTYECVFNSAIDAHSSQLAKAHANGVHSNENKIHYNCTVLTAVFPTSIMFTITSTLHVVGCAFVLLIDCICHEITVVRFVFPRLPLPQIRMSSHWTINHSSNDGRTLVCPTEKHSAEIKVNLDRHLNVDFHQQPVLLHLCCVCESHWWAHQTSVVID